MWSTISTNFIIIINILVALFYPFQVINYKGQWMRCAPRLRRVSFWQQAFAEKRYVRVSAPVNSRVNVVVQSMTPLGWVGSKGLLALPRVLDTLGSPQIKHFFAKLPSERLQKGDTQSTNTVSSFSWSPSTYTSTVHNNQPNHSTISAAFPFTSHFAYKPYHASGLSLAPACCPPPTSSRSSTSGSSSSLSASFFLLTRLGPFNGMHC